MCAWLLILGALCSLGATSAQAAFVSGLGEIAVNAGALDWGIGALQQALDAQTSAIYNVSRSIVVALGAAEMLDAVNNFIDARPETQFLAGRITLPDLVSTWLNEYARAKSIEDLGQIYESLQAGFTVDSDGVMYYNGQACAFLDDLCEWLWLDGPQLVEYADTVENDPVYTLGAVSLGYYETSSPYKRWSGSSKVDTYIAVLGTLSDNPNTGYPRFGAISSGTSGSGIYLTRYLNASNKWVYYGYAPDNNVSFTFGRDEGGASNHGAILTASTTNTSVHTRFVAMLTYAPDPVTLIPEYYDGVPISAEIPSVTDLSQYIASGTSRPVGNPGLFRGVSSVAVDPSDFVSVDQPTGTDWTVTPSEWLRVVTDVVSGNDSTSMTITQEGTGASQRVYVTPSDQPSAPGTPIQPAPEINPTVPNTTVPTFDLPEITGDWNGTSSYEVNIRDLFPFCIPFDILALCQLFAAEPVAPAFELPIKSEAYGIDETVEFDLSPFDGLAATVRTVEKVAFLIGLAFVTKQLLGG